jgi:phage tail sheath protein FI
LMDVPIYDDQGARIYNTALPNIQNTISRFSSRAINNSYVAAYFPDVSVVDADTGSRIRTAASSVALGALAQNDALANPWFAPAGFNRTALSNVASTTCRLNSTDRDDLYEARINPIVRFPGTGFVIFGQKTLQSTKSALDRVNVRRLVLALKRDVGEVASRFLFDQNDAATRANFVASATPVLLNVQNQQGVQQFRIICDETNNTQSDIINNTMNVRIIIVPTRAVEYIVIDFIINNTGVQFV